LFSAWFDATVDERASSRRMKAPKESSYFDSLALEQPRSTARASTAPPPGLEPTAPPPGLAPPALEPTAPPPGLEPPPWESHAESLSIALEQAKATSDPGAKAVEKALVNCMALDMVAECARAEHALRTAEVMAAWRILNETAQAVDEADDRWEKAKQDANRAFHDLRAAQAHRG
jgi:hypothetical protein